MEWALADGGGTLAPSQDKSCANFYANLCAFDAERFVEILKDESDQKRVYVSNFNNTVSVTVDRVLASGGFDLLQMDPLDACTDGRANTPCVASDREKTCRKGNA